MVLLWLLIALTILAPVAYVVITWDHEVVRMFGALPAPQDLGTREFRWRCWLSPMTRNGWRKTILRSPCPRITLQCPFALLSADFAKLATTLGFQKLELDQLPFIVPQVTASCMLLQLFGNSNFPASVRNMSLKALTICQVRPLDMRFYDAQDPEKQPAELSCVMVLTQKRFLEKEIEFSVQTDLFDDQGTLWQSEMHMSLPFEQQTLVPLSSSMAQLDEDLVSRDFSGEMSKTFSCSQRRLEEFGQLSTLDLTGQLTPAKKKTPLFWMLGQAICTLYEQKRVPALPLMWSCVLKSPEDATAIPIDTPVTCTSWTTGENAGDAKAKPVTKYAINSKEQTIATGFVRSIGWKYVEDDGTA